METAVLTAIIILKCISYILIFVAFWLQEKRTRELWKITEELADINIKAFEILQEEIDDLKKNISEE